MKGVHYGEKKNTKKVNRDKFVRCEEGEKMYYMDLSKFQQLEKDAKVCYKLNQLMLVNLEILDEYMEIFRITDGNVRWKLVQ